MSELETGGGASLDDQVLRLYKCKNISHYMLLKLRPFKMLLVSNTFFISVLTIVKVSHVGIVKVGYSFRRHGSSTPRSTLEFALVGGAALLYSKPSI